MIEWLRGRCNELGRPLLTRYPDLFLLRVHIVLPLVILLVVIASLAGWFSPVTIESVPEIGPRLLFGLMGSLVVALIWVYLVVRDSMRFWPARGLKRMLLLPIAFGCLAGIAAPPVAYAYVLLTRTADYAAGIDTRGLLDSYQRLERDWYMANRSDQVPRDSPDPEGRLRELIAAREKAATEYRADRLRLAQSIAKLTPKANETALEPQEILPDLSSNLYTLESAKRNLEKFDVSLALAFACAGLVLATFVLLRETSLRFGLISTGCFVAYSGLLAVMLDLSKVHSDKAIGAFALAHWLALSAIACVQWIRRSNSWFARVTGAMLCLLTPFLALAMATSFGIQKTDRTLVLVIIASFGLYVLVFPFVHGNLARLRFLPRP